MVRACAYEDGGQASERVGFRPILSPGPESAILVRSGDLVTCRDDLTLPLDSERRDAHSHCGCILNAFERVEARAAQYRTEPAARGSFREESSLVIARSVPTAFAALPPAWREFRERRSSADDILRAFQVQAPPVPVDAILEGMGVRVLSDYALDGAGLLEYAPDGPLVLVNAADVHARQRFTMAHELGHLMLHEPCQQNRDVMTDGSRREVQANRFAADLLMPFWMLESFVSRYGASPSRLASIFEVSPQAMDIRLGAMSGWR